MWASVHCAAQGLRHRGGRRWALPIEEICASCAGTSLGMLAAKRRSIRAFGLTSAVVSDGKKYAYFDEGLIEALKIAGGAWDKQ